MAPDFINHLTLGTGQLTAEQKHRLYVAQRLGWGTSRITLPNPLPEIDPALAAIVTGSFRPGGASGAPLVQ